MIINREHVVSFFKEYTDRYDSTDGKIALKIYHTGKVAEACDLITASPEASSLDRDIAWLLGMLHDVGRFEQVRRYKTFVDAKSINHGELGADILFKEGLINSFITCDKEEDARMLYIIETAIRVHSIYRVPDNLDEETVMYCNLIRDADKIDILRVNVEEPPHIIYEVSEAELRHSPITPEVLDAFYEEHAVLRSLKRNPLDNLIGHISLVYELVFPVSKAIAREQGYVYKMLEYKSSEPQVQLQLNEVKQYMTDYLNR